MRTLTLVASAFVSAALVACSTGAPEGGQSTRVEVKSLDGAALTLQVTALEASQALSRFEVCSAAACYGLDLATTATGTAVSVVDADGAPLATAETNDRGHVLLTNGADFATLAEPGPVAYDAVAGWVDDEVLALLTADALQAIRATASAEATGTPTELSAVTGALIVAPTGPSLIGPVLGAKKDCACVCASATGYKWDCDPSGCSSKDGTSCKSDFQIVGPMLP